MTCEDETFWEAELQRILPDPAKALEDESGYVCCPVCQVLVGVPWDFLRALPMRWQREHALSPRDDLAGFLMKDTPELRGTRTHDEKRAPRRVVLKTAGNEEV